MKIDVIICTYNRHFLLRSLLLDLEDQLKDLTRVLIIDSSTENIQFQKNEKFISSLSSKYVHIKSKIANQPFQRLLGASISLADVCVFFDDDIRLLEEDLFRKISRKFLSKEIVGVSSLIKYWHNRYMDRPESIPLVAGRLFSKLILKRISPGEISFNGVVNSRQPKNGLVEYFQGPFMSFRRKEFLSSFSEKDWILLDTFQEKIGGGEDKYLSFGITPYGQLYRFSDAFVSHPNQDSIYGGDLNVFFTRVVFSRFILSKKVCDLKNKSWFFPFFLHIGVIFFGSIGSFLLTFRKASFLKIVGIIRGTFLFLKYLFFPGNFETLNWKEELERESSNFD
jgi:glycosyltransferase involved in cell wall biosynthesis